MKIFYAVQATGNGHLSRATQLYPYLKKYGEVDFFVSGSNSTIDYAFPVKYRSQGISLHYSECGGLDYWDIFKKVKLRRVNQEANSLPLHEYDIIINDFDFITSLACKRKGLPSVQFGHQASFRSSHTPRPSEKSLVGEFVLKNFARCTQYIGLHFKSYDAHIFPPIIKEEIEHSHPEDLGHITVYLPSYDRACLLASFQKLKTVHFHWFLPEVKQVETIDNITYYPVNQHLFNQSMITSHGVITGGGFETPAEALYLGKKLMSIPIRKHYEQQCNAAALAQLGVTTLETADETFHLDVENWLNQTNHISHIKPNKIEDTLNYLIDNYPSKMEKVSEFLFV